MNDKTARLMVTITALFLIISGAVLYMVFTKQGISKNNLNNYKHYDINDYIEVTPIVYDDYSSVYNEINVSKINIKNIDEKLIKDFIEQEKEIIGYINGYYNEIVANVNYTPINTASSTIKSQINDTILSIYYNLKFELDPQIFSENIKNYTIVLNIDLGTNKVLTNDDLLNKYNYEKEYIAEKIFNDEILIEKGQIVIDKNTNMSLTSNDIFRKKNKYIDDIITEFDNIIYLYTENNTLVMTYDSKELKNLFFDNIFDTNIKFKYLK